jgi:hypothetical protein
MLLAGGETSWLAYHALLRPSSSVRWRTQRAVVASDKCDLVHSSQVVHRKIAVVVGGSPAHVFKPRSDKKDIEGSYFPSISGAGIFICSPRCLSNFAGTRWNARNVRPHIVRNSKLQRHAESQCVFSTRSNGAMNFSFERSSAGTSQRAHRAMHHRGNETCVTFLGSCGATLCSVADG